MHNNAEIFAAYDATENRIQDPHLMLPSYTTTQHARQLPVTTGQARCKLVQQLQHAGEAASARKSPVYRYARE